MAAPKSYTCWHCNTVQFQLGPTDTNGDTSRVVRQAFEYLCWRCHNTMLPPKGQFTEGGGRNTSPAGSEF
jgi:hypothetical protein